MHRVTLYRKNYAHYWTYWISWPEALKILPIHLDALSELANNCIQKQRQAVPELQAKFYAIRKQFQILLFNVQPEEEEEEEIGGRYTRYIWNIQVIKCKPLIQNYLLVSLHEFAKDASTVKEECKLVDNSYGTDVNNVMETNEKYKKGSNMLFGRDAYR